MPTDLVNDDVHGETMRWTINLFGCWVVSVPQRNSQLAQGQGFPLKDFTWVGCPGIQLAKCIWQPILAFYTFIFHIHSRADTINNKLTSGHFELALSLHSTVNHTCSAEKERCRWYHLGFLTAANVEQKV